MMQTRLVLKIGVDISTYTNSADGKPASTSSMSLF